jgi:glycosyltransferase involved in cell wall biosynthesis
MQISPDRTSSFCNGDAHLTDRIFERPDRVVFINDMTIARGGATVLAIAGAKLVRERGVQVTFFAGDHGDVDGSLRAANIESISLGGDSLLDTSKIGAATRGLFNIKAYEAMRDWIKKNDTPKTVYHLHGWQQILSPAIFTALRTVAGRTLLHAHDYFLVCPNGGQMNYVTNTACSLRPMSFDCLRTNCDKRNFVHKVWRVGRQAIRNFTSDLTESNITIALIQRGMTEAFTRCGVPTANLIVIPNPSRRFSEFRVKAERNKEFQFVGRLVAEKGIEALLAAARRAKVPVRVMGDGPLREKLICRYPEVIFEGWCSHERLTQLVQTARMLVMPSLYPEPYGLVVPEAISSGIPVILSESALLASDVVQNNLGLAVNPTDIEAFEVLLKNCAADDLAIGEMSKRGFDRPNDISMLPERWASVLLDTYGKLIARNHVL